MIDQSVRSDRRNTIIFSFLILAFFLAAAIYYSFLCDDAFITFRVAHNLAEGLGPVFNPGERVEGYTSFLWMILMAFVIRVGGSPEIWSRIFSISFSVATVLVFLKAGGRGKAKYLFAAFVVFSAPFIAWSTGGMETAAFAFFIFSGVALLIDGIETNRTRSYFLSSIFLSLAALTRPEGVLVFIISLVILMAVALLRKASFGQAALFLIPFVVIYGVYFSWRFGYYGHLFPNTFYVKAPRSALARLGLVYSWYFFIQSAPWIPLLLVAYQAIRSKRMGIRSSDILIIIICLIYAVYIVFVGGDFMGLYRFWMPLLPLIYYLFYRLYNSSFNVEKAAGNIIMCISALVLFFAFNMYHCLKSEKVASDYNVDSIGFLRYYVDEWSDVGSFLRQFSLPSDTIAITAAGALPYYSNLYSIDMRGLEAPDLSQYEMIPNSTRPGHFLTLVTRYLFKVKPQFIIGHPRIVLQQSDEHPFGTRETLSPKLQEYYLAVSAELPGYKGRFWQFWVRKDIAPRLPREFKLYPLQ